MISCTEFIPSYSLLFTWLEEKVDYDEVVRYWEYISGSGLKKLEAAIKEKGLFGCWEYWKHTLNEEAADFVREMHLNEDGTGYMISHMRYCPSMGRLLEFDHFAPYHAYCEHCNVLYPPLLEKYGIREGPRKLNAQRATCASSRRMDEPPAPEIAAAGWQAALKELENAEAEGITAWID
ncbi:MAG: hypothetical protein GX900_05390 [Clostridiaceae bacterium]|nr:hypothetical protein [Clostridiaceae bacterium]